MKHLYASIFVVTAGISLIGFHGCEISPGTLERDSLRIVFEISHVDVYGDSTGQIVAHVSGGRPPYSWSWSNGDTGRILEGIGPGIYRVTVSDKAGAVKQDSAEIHEGRPEVSDIDGNVYPTVQIGEQVWMKENLRVIHAPDGTPISSYCYNDDTANVQTFGRLYTWEEAMNGSVLECSQGICPNGWHIPSDGEWIELEIYLGMPRKTAEMDNVWRGTDEGAG